jgi:predicted DNA-binding protein
MATQREQLLRKREDHKTEQTWHRFLIDAYQGTGGFEGRIKRPESVLGSAASSYNGVGCDSYLDKYHREDDDKFARRKLVAHYVNYVGALTELKVSFMLRKPFVIENLPDQIVAWKANADGEGNTMDRVRERAATLSAILGWVPTPVDRDPVPNGVTNLAQAKAIGVVQPRVVVMYPADLTEWDIVNGGFRWAKVQTNHCERETPWQDEPRKFHRVMVWFKDKVQVFEIDEATSDVKIITDTVHPFGTVPVPICRHKEAEGVSVYGLPMHGDASIESRRLFNLGSELDETLRAHGFPILVLAEEIGKVGSGPDEPDGGDDRTVGTENALILDQSASQKHYYLEMTGQTAEAFEKRIENTVREIYRTARVQFDRVSGDDESGIARKHAFAATNAAIASFASNVARWEQEVYVLVGRALGISEDKLAAIRVIAPADFDIEDLDAEMKRTLDALSARLGETASKLLRMRLVKKVLPDLDDDTLAKVEDELDKQATEDAAMAAFNKSGDDKDPPDEDDPEKEPDDDTDEAEPDPGEE